MARPWMPFAQGVLLAASLLLAACGGPNDRELLASAKQHLQKGERPSAIIQLKSALQRNPQSGEARYLLGQALLDGGDAAAATIELRKAADAGVDESRVAPALATAYLATGDDRRVVQAYAGHTLADAAANASLQTTLALAYGRQDKPELMQQALDAALAAKADHAPALMLKARLAAGRQDGAAAMALLDGIIQRDPTQFEAWLLKGELQQRLLVDPDAALASYQQAVKLRPELMAGHEAILSLLLLRRDLPGAQAHLSGLKKAYPARPEVRLMEAQLAYASKDYKAAAAMATPLVQLAPNNPIVLQLAGAAQYQTGALPEAENLLAQAVHVAPNLVLATHLLARTYLRTAQPEKALEALKTMLGRQPPFAETYLLAGQAYLQTGKSDEAERAFARAKQIQPDSSRARTALALSQMSKGRETAGLAALESISADSGDTVADLALLASHLRRNDLPQALKAIDQLEKKRPLSPEAAYLRGRIMALRRDPLAARASYERALALDKQYFPAAAGLTALDLAEHKPDAARARLAALIQQDPKNYRAMVAMAELLRRSGGGADEVLAQLRAAVQAAPAAATPRLLLIEQLLQGGNAKAALDAAQQANAALPERRDLVLALGRTQLANKDYQQALTSFKRLAKLQPDSTAAALGTGEALIGQKAYDAAEKHLQEVLQAHSGLLAARRMLVGIYVSDARHDKALVLARDLQKLAPAQSAGFELEAEIEAQRKQWEPALASLRVALQKRPAPELAARMHAALRAAQRQTDADKFAGSWLKAHPTDAVFRFYLGDAALTAGDWALAEARYRDVLQAQPDNAAALNNVAWLMVRQNKPGALAFAEKANAARPGQTALLDTLALALAADQQFDRAITLHKKTLKMAPDDPSLRLTMARLYLQSGAKREARAELDDLAKLGPGFREQAEVFELLKRL